MLENLLDFLKDKKILILGFGVEGKASYNFIRKFFKDKKIYIADKKEIILDENLIIDIKNKKIELIIGDNYLDNLEDYDLILKTPGLSFKGIDISKFEDKIYTSIDLFLKYFRIITIGITGTKGKSTTSSLIYEILKNEKKDVYLLGNIGIPIFDKIENIKEDSIVVIELSSHQLQFMKYTTNIAILINIFPEHLDHYNSYEEYINCKYNIFLNSNNMLRIYSDFKQKQIYGKETEDMLKKKFKYNEDSVEVDLDNNQYIIKNEKYIKKINEDEIFLKGKHNLQNIMFAIEVAKILNLNIDNVINTIKNFKGLPHRLEYVTTYNNVKYYNDSISTIPQTTIIALETLNETETLIIGGLNRGIDYNVLVDFLNQIYDESKYMLKNIILLPDTGYMLENNIRNEYNKIKVKDVKDAVYKAVEITKKGICLLSPAAASYGFYKNFEERGNIFKQIIHEIKDLGGKS